MDYFAASRNVGIIEKSDGVGKGGNPVCGDVMELFIKVDNGIIIDARFRTFGCGIATQQEEKKANGKEKSLF